MTEVEAFAERLIAELEKPAPGRIVDSYVHVDRLKQVIQRALQPEHVTEEFPKMLFRDGNTADYRIVGDADEEARALAENYGGSISPGPPGFPKHFVENSHRGGNYNSGYRRVTLRTPTEWNRFLAVVEADDWTEDAEHQLGGRGVGLAELVEERRNQIKALVDRDELEIVPEPAADVERDRDNDSAAAAETRGN